ncbi:Flp pilus assembly protein CpaB [Bordetella holmesii]|nr:Flp pilus assembly protein CpaB [Bordetella holmesii]
MNSLTKIAAVFFLLVALALGYLAVRLAMREAPPPPPAQVAQSAPAPAEKTHAVVVAKKDLEAGTRLSNDMLEVAQWNAAPDIAVADPGLVSGHILRQAVAKGQPVGPYVLAKGLAAHLAPGERAITIPVDEIVGAQNRIRPGDLIDVFMMMERGPEVQGSQMRLLQSRVKVLAYGRDSVDGPGEPDRAAGGGSGNPAPVARNAMLAVPVAQVNEPLLAARAGKLQLALRSPEDTAVPDPSLFVASTPVLAPRANLTADQNATVHDGVNMAFAAMASRSWLAPLRWPSPRRAPRRLAPAAALKCCVAQPYRTWRIDDCFPRPRRENAHDYRTHCRKVDVAHGHPGHDAGPACPGAKRAGGGGGRKRPRRNRRGRQRAGASAPERHAGSYRCGGSRGRRCQSARPGTESGGRSDHHRPQARRHRAAHLGARPARSPGMGGARGLRCTGGAGGPRRAAGRLCRPGRRPGGGQPCGAFGRSASRRGRSGRRRQTGGGCVADQHQRRGAGGSQGGGSLAHRHEGHRREL